MIIAYQIFLVFSPTNCLRSPAGSKWKHKRRIHFAEKKRSCSFDPRTCRRHMIDAHFYENVWSSTMDRINVSQNYLS